MKETQISDCYKIDLPKINAENDSALSVIEKDIIPFECKRVFYLYNVPDKAKRGVHAHKELIQFLIPISGSFDVILKDSQNEQKISLTRPNEGLLIKPGIWSELENFSEGAVCLVLASDTYDEADYIRNYTDFLMFKK